MQLIQNLYDHFYEKARTTTVACLSIGLKYTAVTTDDGGMGLAFTYHDGRHCHSRKSVYNDYEDQPAIALLEKIKGPSPLHRSMGLALVNALNYPVATALPDDSADRNWMDTFDIHHGTHVAMVGFIRPLAKKMRAQGAVVEVIDDQQGIGERDAFYRKVREWADVLILTSTSILNESTEDLLKQTRPHVKSVMIGPSTPLVADAFRHLPVQMLAGTVPVDQTAVLKAIRHGEGTPVIHRSSRKVLCDLV